MRKIAVRVFLLLLTLTASICLAQEAQVSLSISDFPAAIWSGRDFSVVINYGMNLHLMERRARLSLEVRDTRNSETLTRIDADNNGDGFGEPTGSHLFTLRLDSPPSSVYFVAYASPLEMNNVFVQHLQTYPTDGTYPYKWHGGGYGVTRDVYYKGSLIAPTNPEHTTYCCGITFENFMIGYEDYNVRHGYNSIGTMNVSDAKDFRKLWYGVTDAEKLCVRAITDYDLGWEIADKTKALPGDFCQLWRHSGSGHSVVFIEYLHNDGEITGLRYWSSQPPTDGIGYQTEYFGETSGINRNRFYIGRVRKPADPDDWRNCLADAATRQTPTSVLAPQDILDYVLAREPAPPGGSLVLDINSDHKIDIADFLKARL